MTRDVILGVWRTRLAEWSSLGVQVDGERVCRQVIADIESLAALESDELVGLTEAARRSGYSADHLGRLVREGKITNHSTKGRPKIRVSDLPTRPKLSLDAATDHGYNADTDARSLVNARRMRRTNAS